MNSEKDDKTILKVITSTSESYKRCLAGINTGILYSEKRMTEKKVAISVKPMLIRKDMQVLLRKRVSKCEF